MKKLVLIMIIFPILLFAQDWDVSIAVDGSVPLDEDLQALNTQIKNGIDNTLTEAKYSYDINIVERDTLSYYYIKLRISGKKNSVDNFASQVDTFFENKFDQSFIHLRCKQIFDNTNR